MSIQQQQGSTLIEVVVAMIILAMLIAGLNAGVVSLIGSNLNSRDLNSATTVGYQLFEEFRRLDYDSLSTMAATSLDTVRSRFIRTWGLDVDTFKTTISLTVEWPIAANPRHEIALSTIIAQP